VSRQVAKLADLGLIDRRPSPTDRRVSEAVLSGEGRKAIDALDAARHRLTTPVFSQWSDRDLLELERLLRRYVDDLQTRAQTLEDGERKTCPTSRPTRPCGTPCPTSRGSCC
jgi:hypothetical protein